MLKALDILGFKSFADKTRFEFPPGITVVVGPNGSGKSNVVDAIKWVLGEQSVKSLRGKEMADVIFNGSGSRRATNSAEITVTFDNSNHLLPLDTPEVHITRRVYRSGEGEYLINRQPSRLRDIRELLSGTGMGTQAYSVIEQGKVDGLLQSSARDRRIIFEEAAGISLFKAKKLEAIRRLERVEQNLLRLADIVDEVDSRLRSVRAQAGKARRYQEYTNRLQELRTQVALVDWHRLTERIDAFQTELAELRDQRQALTTELDATDVRLVDQDHQSAQLNEEIRRCEGRIAENRERIAGRESTLEHERRRGRDLEQEITRAQQRLAEMRARAGDLQQQLVQTRDEVLAAETRRQEIARQVVDDERELTELIGQLDRARAEHKQHEAAYHEQMSTVAALGKEVSGLESQVAAAEAAEAQNAKRVRELDGQLAALARRRAELEQQASTLTGRADRLEQDLTQAQETLERTRRQRDAAREELGRRQARRDGIAQRVQVLEDLERRQEGLGPGAKEVLAAAQNATDGPFAQVRGLVADRLRVSVENAPLVEVALGSAASRVVVASGRELREYLCGQSYRFTGRVGFVWLDNAHETSDLPDLEGQPGVLGRADQFVETDPAYTPLATKLLGRTWFVEKLSYAIDLAVAQPGTLLRFVTLAGELLEADGTLTVGPSQAAGGLISRRSELRELRNQQKELDDEIHHASLVVEGLAEQIDTHQGRVRQLTAEHRKATDALAEHRHQMAAAQERESLLQTQRRDRESELESARSRREEAAAALEGAAQRLTAAQSVLGDLETELRRLDARGEELESQHHNRHQSTTQIKVELAKSEERLGNLQSRMRQFEESQQERDRGLAENREQLDQCRQRAEQSRWNVLRAESEIAELYLLKEKFAAETVELIGRRDALAAGRGELTAQAQKIRNRIQKLDEKIHAEDLAAGEILHQRSTLADRLREDYQIELSELEVAPTEEEQHRREEVQEEIDDLRRKIGNLGNVNLEALAELQELEGRWESMSAQHKDLSEAKNELLRIIERINADSRRLFSETLQTVRGHFQQLFRDLFGGGHADIVLEEDVDILESGIEIVARPPGKEPRSISLLSGGEKTLTCVALLLAIFRSRPSPFCVLDEVDAALDEANIDRFTKVLKDFLAWTQFIIVTHSKKTMTCADTIYGVTMQESGISRQVSVRFEDVSEDGHIQTAPSKDDETQAA
ncbi:MAG: chromosome segregation protein SMC [Pirellulales bacterium]|nr:chromosome segregation protein SMC [Pirellulales bacterium]